MRSNRLPPLARGLGVVLAIAALGIADVDAEDGISFIDQNGRTIELAKPVERVIMIPKPAPAMFVAVDGASSKLVGVHPESKTALLEGILGRFFPAMKDISTGVVSSGFAPNVEEVLRLAPDLVFQWGMDENMISPMEDVGLQVAAPQYDGASDLTVGWLEMMGAATDRNEKVAELIDGREGVRKDIEGRVAAIPADDRPRVLYFRNDLNEYQVQVLYNMVLLGAVNPSLEGGPFAWPLRTIIGEKYREIYGQTPTADEIDGILRVSMNGDSVHYEPFRQ